jgi:uncharacterized membrane protein required for colicin V production
MNWLDLGLVLFIGLLVFLGIKKGFMTTVISKFSLGINALLSFFLCKPIAALFNLCGMGRGIARSYTASMLAKSSDFGLNLLDLTKEELSPFVEQTIDKGFSGFSNKMFDWFLNKPSLYDTLHSSGHQTRSLADIISSAYANFFVTIIAFVTTVALLYLIVWLIKILIEKLRTIGFVKFVDTTLGAIYALFRCLLILIVICFVIKLMSPLSFMQPVTAYINNSFFGNLIYGQISNLLDNYLSFSDLIKSFVK